MAKSKNNKKNHKNNSKNGKKANNFFLPEKAKNLISGVIVVILALIVTLSFFELSGPAGKIIKEGLYFLIGRTIFILPLIFLIASWIFFSSYYKKIFPSILLAVLIIILGISSILENFDLGKKNGGWLGYLIAWPLFKMFDFLATQIILTGIVLIGFFIFWHLLKQPEKEKTPEEEEKKGESIKEPSFIKKFFAPRFKIKEISPSEGSAKAEKNILPELKNKPILEKPVLEKIPLTINYKLPPTNLLEKDKGGVNAGDTRINAAIIKKTLQNFDIPVEMSEVNIGPTVTQYTLKPAEGIKLSKITTLSNDLALALASHPIRIEAPIPGKSLVGIEVPNKTRAQVRLRELIEDDRFQKLSSLLTLALGRDVSGVPVYADLAKMPHLLVAGSTGTGKTIFLNNLMLSLLYKGSPEILRFILVDPKRVEFPVYNELPHLLCPVIFDAARTVNAFKWLISEMERRFDVLSMAKSRDIVSYNQKASETGELLPYIVVVVDELADLMAAKGREIEAGIVRLAQMARAVGIHLVVATQRPSVEVITGLIKANITSRITFQVASQIDSRTVLDTAGAEKLLGAGDMLYLAAELGKPKRIQAAYVSEKEVRKVVEYINSNMKYQKSEVEEAIFNNNLAEDLEKSLDSADSEIESFSNQNDPLYEEAKRVVIEAKKASASLLQRRLRLGYARAARLLDMLEENGVVGPADGAKPREVYFKEENQEEPIEIEQEEWKKV